MTQPRLGILKMQEEATKEEERKFQLSTFEKLAQCVYPAKEERVSDKERGAASPLGGKAT
jgi:hypothetical protein